MLEGLTHQLQLWPRRLATSTPHNREPLRAPRCNFGSSFPLKRRYFSKVVQKYALQRRTSLLYSFISSLYSAHYASICVSRPRHVNLTRMNMRRRTSWRVSAQAHTSPLLCCTSCPVSTCCECTRSSSTRGRWARRSGTPYSLLPRRDAVVGTRALAAAAMSDMGAMHGLFFIS